MKAALLLLLHLPLTYYTEIHTTTDDLMRGISETSRALTVHTAKGSKCTKPTKTFIKAFLDMLCFNLTFNEFIPREKARDDLSQQLVAQAETKLAYNHNILVHYLRMSDPPRFLAIFKKNKVDGKLDITSILKTRREILEKLTHNSGVCTGHTCPVKFPRYPPLWLHQALFLQHVHPVINAKIRAGSLPIISGDPGSWDDCYVTMLTVPFVPLYGSPPHPPNHALVRVAVWKGRDVPPLPPS